METWYKRILQLRVVINWNRSVIEMNLGRRIGLGYFLSRFRLFGSIILRGICTLAMRIVEQLSSGKIIFHHLLLIHILLDFMLVSC